MHSLPVSGGVHTALSSNVFWRPMSVPARSGSPAVQRALLACVLLASAVRAQGTADALAVAVLGPEEPAAGLPARLHGGGQVPLRSSGGPVPTRTSPALAVLVDGRARALVDPVAGTLVAARAASVELGQVRTVLLSSMRP